MKKDVPTLWLDEIPPKGSITGHRRYGGWGDALAAPNVCLRRD